VCGRYTVSTTAELVEEVFGVDTEDLEPRWNIAPTEPAPVVRAADGGRRLDLLRWGLRGDSATRGERRPWQAARRGAPPLHINARGETAAELPAFREAFAMRRCLVPADGFYEWTGSGRQRRGHHIRFPDRRLFAFAGLWDTWPGDGPAVEAFTILTCPPSELVAPLHDRMPVILPPAEWERWLRAPADDELRALLRPWEGDPLEVVAVGPYVNRAGNEGPECLLPPPPPAQPAQRHLFS
jgi:putative SOS response-associated peptidase YedK